MLLYDTLGGILLDLLRGHLFLLLLGKHHILHLPIQVFVALDHELFEGDEILHCSNLVNDLLMNRILLRFLTGL